MRVSEILKNVYWVQFKTQRQLAETFLRFQEHYESPHKAFRQRPFTFAEFKRWYIKRYGAFTYFKDWSGFNVPGSVLASFRAGEFNGMSQKEVKLLNAFEGVSLAQAYVIGTSTDNKDEALEHEIAHALFGTDPDYRKNVLDILHRFHEELLPVFKYVARSKYAPNVAHDEVHAYVTFDLPTLSEGGVDIKPLGHVSDLLLANFAIYRRKNTKGG